MVMILRIIGVDSTGSRSVGARIVAHGCAQQVEIDQVPVWGRMRTEKEQGTRKRQFCYSLEL